MYQLLIFSAFALLCIECDNHFSTTF